MQSIGCLASSCRVPSMAFREMRKRRTRRTQRQRKFRREAKQLRKQLGKIQGLDYFKEITRLIKERDQDP